MKTIAKRDLIESHLQGLIPDLNCPFKHLFESCRYALLGGGKRLRPLLTLMTAETLGIDSKDVLNAACAIEMIHAYSLIHDDLPCMDDDDFRRGRPSVHKAFGEGLAVLTGDYLLTRAFSILADDIHIGIKERLSLISLLAKRAAAPGMIAGQVMDLNGIDQKTDKLQQLEILKEIHRMKTGALIEASILFGCIIAKATTDVTKHLSKFALELGLAFQIKDDIIDVTDSLAKRGTLAPSDIYNNKTTYVTILRIEGAKEQAATHQQNALHALTLIPYDTSELREFVNRLIGNV